MDTTECLHCRKKIHPSKVATKILGCDNFATGFLRKTGTKKNIDTNCGKYFHLNSQIQKETSAIRRKNK